jgi:hypothetical protein
MSATDDLKDMDMTGHAMAGSSSGYGKPHDGLCRENEKKKRRRGDVASGREGDTDLHEKVHTRLKAEVAARYFHPTSTVISFYGF